MFGFLTLPSASSALVSASTTRCSSSDNWKKEESGWMNKSPFSYLVQVKVHSMSRISRCRSRIRKMSRVVYISTLKLNLFGNLHWIRNSLKYGDCYMTSWIIVENNRYHPFQNRPADFPLVGAGPNFCPQNSFGRYRYV